MIIEDINKLQRDNQTDLIDFNKQTIDFERAYSVQFANYIVRKGEEMRIDLVCNSIYKSLEYIDILLSVNFISNPLNIKEGSILRYPVNNIDVLRLETKKESTVQEKMSKLANPDKNTKVDPNRQKYVESNYSLPPTVLQKPTEQVVLNNKELSVGVGLFTK